MNSENPYELYQTQDVVEVPIQTSGTLVWKLFSFQGRIPRRAWWGLTLLNLFLFYLIIILVLGSGLLPLIVQTFVGSILYVLVLWISLALHIKRWHDRGYSGWWVLVGLIPLIGSIVVFVQLGCLRGTFGPNHYGADPT